MAASMMSTANISKKMFRYVLLGNFLMCLLISLVAFVPLNRNLPIDHINNSLFATKISSLSILLLHGAFQMWLFQFHPPKTRTGPTVKIVQDLLRRLLYFSLSVIFFHCIAVLFGAAFTEFTAETFHFALILSTTSVAPALIHLGTNSEAWLRVFIFNRPELGVETMVLLTSVCSVVGAWFGAFPIPLDWDRPWQVWPVSCVLGTLFGYCLGLLISSIYLIRQYQKLHKIKFT